MADQKPTPPEPTDNWIKNELEMAVEALNSTLSLAAVAGVTVHVDVLDFTEVRSPIRTKRIVLRAERIKAL